MSATITWCEKHEDDKAPPKVVPIAGRMSRRWGTETMVNPKYPGGLAVQRRLLRSEGHTLVRRGARESVANWERAVFNFSTREPL